MESRKQKLHYSTSATETPVLLSSTLPTNFVQFSSSTLFPLPSSSAYGNVLSVPIVNNPLVSHILQTQQLPMQSEPLLLLPASALSFSGHSNFVVSTPSLSSQIQPSSILHSHSLHLNSAQVPLMLKSLDSSLQVNQALKSHQMSQQLIVLPVSGGHENSASVLDHLALSKTISEHKNVIQNENQLRDRQNDHHSKQDLTRLTTVKCEFTKAKLKMRNTNTKATCTTKSDISTESSVLDTSNCELNKLDIAQIISNIPSGWKVVGVTGLDQLALEDILSPPSSSSSITSLLAITPKTSISGANSEVKSEAGLLTEATTRHDQPSLVSVNLNTASQPVASETVFDKWPAKELTCSVKMDDIPCTHVISIKTESVESSEDNFGKEEDELHFERISNDHQELAKTNENHNKSCSTIAMTNLQAQESSRKGAAESYVTSENAFLQDSTTIKSSGSDSSSNQPPVLADSKWTIIGITSLSPLPSTSTVTVSQAGMTALGESSNICAGTSNATILNIPICPSVASRANEDNITNNSNKKALHKARGSSPVSLILNEENKSSSDIDLYTKTKPEDLKWTIVGLMGSPLTNSSALNPCTVSGSEFLRNSQPITSFSQSSTRLENATNNQLLSILSPLSSTVTSPVLLTADSSPNQISPSTQGKRKPKSQDVKKFQKSRSSANKDESKLDDCSPQSQSQWKIVGVTQLGIPPTSASPIVSVSQLNSISPVMSMPLLIPSASGPLFSNLTAESTSMVTQTTGTTPTSSLFSLSTLPSLFSQPALPFPVFSLNGTTCNSTMTLSPSSSLLSAAHPSSIQTMQNVTPQQNLNQLIQSQLTACQNPISMLTLNESSQWNVVGVVANNQVSLLNSNQSNPPAANTVTAEPTLDAQDAASHVAVTSTQNIKAKRNISNSDGRKRIRGAASSKSVTIRQSLATSRREDSEVKRYHFKCKDMVSKHQQESTKIKKNTVSNLLRMKRMQQGTCENGSSEDGGDQSFEDYQDFTDMSYEVPQKKTKTRSLRSYAGNRKIFTRKQNKAVDEKISLRSGTQIPVLLSKSEEEDDDEDVAQILPDSSRKMEERVADTDSSVREAQNNDKPTEVTVHIHSSSRRRKLKVPRKLIADLDYHPFDSSSDSN